MAAVSSQVAHRYDVPDVIALMQPVNPGYMRTMDRSSRHRRQDAEHIVRPREVWGGVVLAIVGMALVAWGVIGGSVAIAVGGVVVGAVALGIAWRGGILYDAHARSDLTAELEAVEEGAEYHGASPEQNVRARLPRRESEEIARRRRRVDTRPQEPLSTSSARAAPTLLLALAAWTFFGQFLLALPFEETAVDTRIRVSGIAVALALAALALRQASPSKIALGVSALCGLALVLSFFLAPHAVPRSRWSELVTGVLVLFGTAVAAGAFRRATPRPPARRRGAGR